MSSCREAVGDDDGSWATSYRVGMTCLSKSACCLPTTTVVTVVWPSIIYYLSCGNDCSIKVFCSKCILYQNI